jgi:hypothetical protein
MEERVARECNPVQSKWHGCAEGVAYINGSIAVALAYLSPQAMGVA